MAGIFETAIQQVNSSVGTISSLIWNPANQNTTSFGALGSVPTGAVIKDITIINTGTTNIYCGFGSAAVATTLGMMVTANGGQLTLQGYTATGGSTPNQIWANTGTVGLTSSSLAGLPSVTSVI